MGTLFLRCFHILIFKTEAEHETRCVLNFRFSIACETIRKLI